MAQHLVDRLLAGAAPAAAQARLRFACLGDAAPPRGYEQMWLSLSADAEVAEQPWATQEAMRDTAALVVLAGISGESQKAAFTKLAAYFRDHPTIAPPVMLVPLVGAGGIQDAAEIGQMRAWVAQLVHSSILDDVIWGMPAGYALTFAVQAKLQSLSCQLAKLQELLDSRHARADAKEIMETSINFARWHYLRARLLPAIPVQRANVEDVEAGTVAGFKLGHKISRGAFGTVYAAARQAPAAAAAAPQSGQVGMLVVSKRQGVRNLSDLTMINRFVNVMHRIDDFRHPNVSRLVEAHHSQRYLYFCMDLAGPRNLFRRLFARDLVSADKSEPKPIPGRVLQSLMTQICRAVCHLHLKAHVCHRDLKPENFTVQERADGEIDLKLNSFELATVQTPEQVCKMLCGTMPFAAPEMIIAGADGYDGKAADMWSLGVVLLEVACGLRSVEKALPPISEDLDERRPNELKRNAPPSSEVAREVQRVFARPGFVQGLVERAVPEAKCVLHWLVPVVSGLLDVSPSGRIDAATLEPSVA